MYHILIVEDDPQIVTIVSDYFTGKDAMEVEMTVAHSGLQGMELAYEKEYDLILLDIMLPGANGFEVCREIRKKSIVPIIFITARGREEDVLQGYLLGCDDYVVKPFMVSALYAKAQALLKRAKGLVGTDEIICGDIVIHPAQISVKVCGEKADLSPKEYMLLKYLAEHKNLAVSRDTLLVAIWGYDYEGSDRVVDSHIKKLRKHLRTAGGQIKTLYTKGYMLSDSAGNAGRKK